MKSDSQPLVSIVIPCYNHENFVQECIQSVIDQTYQNIELIIIDDGSKDNSVEKIQKMIPRCQERFVRFEFRHRPNKGLSATLNEGLEWCTGIYYSAIASDDLMCTRKTEIQVNYLNVYPESIGVFGYTALIDIKGNQLNDYIKNKKFKRNYFEDIFLSEYTILAPTQMCRLACIRRVGGYIQGYVIEDWLMWLKLTEKGGYLDTLPEILAYYRDHDNNTYKNISLMHNERLKILSLYRDHRLYKLALANEGVLFANELLAESLPLSLRYFFINIAKSHRSIFRKFTVIYLRNLLKKFV